MNTSSMSVLLSSVGVSFVLGFGIAWNIQSPETSQGKIVIETTQTPQQAESKSVSMNQMASVWNNSSAAPAEVATTSNNARANASLDELFARATAPADKQKPGDDAADRLQKMAMADPSAMRNLMHRYDTVRSPEARELLKSVLSSIQKPEVVAFSTKLATSGDAAQRKDGFELLQQSPISSPEVRNVVKQALATEQTPAVLVQALVALRPTAVEPAESDSIVAQLRTLSQHADPSVRSQSITQLAQWDKAGDGQGMTQALADQSPEVRQAAIFAVAQSGVRSDSVKAALMNIINNANETRDVKGSALQVLERFSLNRNELASYSQARAKIQ